MVQQDHPVGDHEWVVVGEAEYAGAELDVLGALGRCTDEHLRRGYCLPAAAVVLSDPGLVVAQLVEPLKGLHVALEGEGGVLGGPVERRHENAESHAGGQRHDLLLS